MFIHFLGRIKYVHEKGVAIGRIIEKAQDGDIIVAPTVDDRLTVETELRRHVPEKNIKVVLPEDYERVSKGGGSW